MVEALGSPSRSAIVRRARALVERRYDWTQTVEAFEAIYRR
jgi:glycosyltransferase involved in cell wall biosynthesis